MGFRLWRFDSISDFWIHTFPFNSYKHNKKITARPLFICRSKWHRNKKLLANRGNWGKRKNGGWDHWGFACSSQRFRQIASKIWCSLRSIFKRRHRLKLCCGHDERTAWLWSQDFLDRFWRQELQWTWLCRFSGKVISDGSHWACDKALSLRTRRKTSLSYGWPYRWFFCFPHIPSFKTGKTEGKSCIIRRWRRWIIWRVRHLYCPEFI